MPELAYPSTPPFHPPVDFPEYPFKGQRMVDPENKVYLAVRESFSLLGLDRASFGKEDWNPLGRIIQPGNIVLIKPNFVLHAHMDGLSLESLVTHASVIRAVLDYVIVALKNRGSVIIGDAPLQEGKWEEIVQNTSILEVVDFCRSLAKVPIELVDFRLERAATTFFGHVIETERLERPVDKCIPVDLGRMSYLAELGELSQSFRVTNYNPDEMPQHHSLQKHEYLIAREMLEADVVINIPKLKTHRKAGITCCLKNMVGINASKDWLPHHTNGSREEGGDQYKHKCVRRKFASDLLDQMHQSNSRIKWNSFNLLRRTILETGRHTFFRFKDPYFEGSWYGNDTIWRTILDLNRILFFATKEGQLFEKKLVRRHFSIVDALIAGEGEGPLHPSPKSCGVIAAGFHPVAVDALCSLMMGYDYRRIPVIREAIKRQTLGEVEWKLISNHWRDEEDLKNRNLGFVPTAGWCGQIELSVEETSCDRDINSFVVEKIHSDSIIDDG
jgi:uncharacterized protein (DUF362 family)